MRRALSLFLCLAPMASGQDFRKVKQTIRIHAPSVMEASGLAVSPQNENFLWLLNDSGAPPLLHLCDVTGKERGMVSVKGAKNVDWEDIAGFTLDGKNYLLIADIGDNNSRRKDCTLYLIEEPPLPADGDNLTSETTPLQMIPIQYEDGPRDCESVAVDVSTRTILLISKRTKPPAIYQIPLNLNGDSRPVVARRICATGVNTPPGNFPVPYENQPTGMSITPDGSLAAVLTYYGVFLFPRAQGETWQTAFSRKPQVLPAHQLPQAEGISFSKDGKTLYVTSEGKNPAVVIYQK